MIDFTKYGITLDDDWIDITKENIEKMNFPRQHVEKIKDVIIIDKDNRWALVGILWDGRYQLATRWFWSKIGDPNSRGYPTWHIIPEGLSKPMLTALHNDSKISDDLYEFYFKKIGTR